MSTLKKLIPDQIKACLRQPLSYLRYRQATWRWRPLPDFIIIGAQKSGTTSLFSYLSQHADLIPSFVKEVHFFDGGLKPDVDNYDRGEPWYRANWPLKRTLETHQRTFEASPLYIFNPLAPERMAGLVPEAKLIAVLRDPTERAVSHYFKIKRKGIESLPIMEALEAEEERLEPALASGDYKSREFIHYSYKKRGLYDEQIERYLKYFPKDQILAISSEMFFAEPGKALRRIFKFVGVDEGFTVEDLMPRNVASNRTKVDPEVYEYLNDYFRPHNEKLYELMGEDYGWGSATGR